MEVNTPITDFNPHRGRFHMVYHRAQFWDPILVLIYINDLPLNIQRAKLILYADDTSVFVIDRNEEALQIKLSSVMKRLENWFLKNGLFINTTKTAAMSFHLCLSKSPFKPCILIQNTEVAYMPEVKF
jgi:hypothetical protein